MRGVGLCDQRALEWPLASPFKLRDFSYPRGQFEAVLEYAVTFVSIDILQPVVLRRYEAGVEFIKLLHRVVEVGHGRAARIGFATATMLGAILTEGHRPSAASPTLLCASRERMRLVLPGTYNHIERLSSLAVAGLCYVW